MLKQNVNKAVELITRAAEGGHPGAAYTYGVLLMKGQGVNKNAAMARKWLTIAKERGVQQAQKALNALGPDS